jgi:hypothetical protein
MGPARGHGSRRLSRRIAARGQSRRSSGICRTLYRFQSTLMTALRRDRTRRQSEDQGGGTPAPPNKFGKRDFPA